MVVITQVPIEILSCVSNVSDPWTCDTKSPYMWIIILRDHCKLFHNRWIPNKGGFGYDMKHTKDE